MQGAFLPRLLNNNRNLKIVLNMKKYLFMAAVIGLAVAATSCNEDKKGTNGDKPVDPTAKVTSITITPSEITLSEGESFKLTAKAQPEGVAATYEWESSDTLVAIVDSRGNVTAVYAGEATITATCDGVKGECKVSVKSFLETIQFTKAVLWSEDTTYYADPVTGKIPVDTIESLDGEQFYAYPTMAELYLCSEGFFVNNEGYFDGADQAAVITVYAPFYYATGFLNHSDRGTVFTLGEWAVSDDPELAGRMHVGAPGAIDEKVYQRNISNFWENYFNGDTETAVSYMKAGSKNFSGSIIETWTYNAESGGYSYSYIPDGLISSAVFSLDIDPVYNYMTAIEYNKITAKILGGAWGFGYEIDVDTVAQTWEMGDEIVFDNTINYSFGTAPAAAPAKFKRLDAVILKEDAPEVAARLEAALKNNQLRRNRK